MMDFQMRSLNRTKSHKKIDSVENIYIGKPDLRNYHVRNRMDNKSCEKLSW